MTATVGALFAGYDGLGLAIESVLGARPIWFSDNAKGPTTLLAHHYPTVPNLGDIESINFYDVPRVDIISGGFPCQDLADTGHRAGMAPGNRSGLWHAMAEAISIVHPPTVIIENVRGLLHGKAFHVGPVGPCSQCMAGHRTEHPLRALGRVLGDLADLGYDAQWLGLPASDVGAPHERYRIFVIATTADVPDAHRLGLYRWPSGAPRRRDEPTDRHSQAVSWGRYAPAVRRWEAILGRPAPAPTVPGIRRAERLSPMFAEWMMGLPEGYVCSPAVGLGRPDQLRLLGNGVVPQQAAAALRALLPIAGAAA